ncbi:MAG: hypothetical protein HN402_09730 [Candidatus Scalindua sp.]|jgi:hypothetical protein|nr:hypothetical protein [Candidatus Scalindua sp.]MBT7557960.1 hypothetical protein [Candidatus Woesearchaeota archaeon]
MKNLAQSTLVGWGITIVIAVAGGTFALTKYLNEQAIKALEQRIAIAEQNSGAKPTNTQSRQIDPSSLNNKEISELTIRLENLESEKRDLIEKISQKAVLTLDPRSELSTLISQLESKGKEERAKAIDGLFMLKDPVSFQPLLRYLESHPEEATEGGNPFIGKWYSFFIEAGGAQGVEFVASQLESSERFYSEFAYSTIKSEIDSTEAVDITIPILQKIAVSSSSSLARTRSKVLIQYFLDNKKKITDEENFDKSEGVPHNLKIISSLNGNGLNHITARMLSNGTDLIYWKTGFYIAQEFIEKPENQDNCIAAIKELVDPAPQMTTSSHCVLLYLLAKMEAFRGNESAANKYSEACKAESTELYKYLTEHDNIYDLKTIHNLFDPMEVKN